MSAGQYPLRMHRRLRLAGADRMKYLATVHQFRSKCLRSVSATFCRACPIAPRLSGARGPDVGATGSTAPPSGRTPPVGRAESTGLALAREYGRSEPVAIDRIAR